MKKITRIKAISFDADGTLWDFEKVRLHSLSLTLTKLETIDSVAANRLTIDKMMDTAERVFGELNGKGARHEEIRLAAFKQTLVEVGRPDDALAAYLTEFYLKHRYNDIELFEDVRPTLKALKSRYKIGVVSNGNSYPDKCGLADTFQYIVFSQDYGIDKPDPRLFHIALDKAGCTAQEMLHIGDSLKNDVIGASGAGMKSVWLNRQKNEADPEIKVEYEIQSLTELLDIL